jgi:hypothetical protein
LQKVGEIKKKYMEINIEKLQNTNFYNSNIKQDIQNKKIENCFLDPVGYIGNRPKDFKGDFHEDDAWAIDIYTIKERYPRTCYLYTSEFEYNEDLMKFEKVAIT